MGLGPLTGSLYEAGHNEQTVCVQRVWKHSCYHYGKLSELSSDGGKYYESVCRQVCVTHRTILLCLFSETVDVELPHHTDQDPLATASTSLLFPHVDEFGESEKCVRACVCIGFVFSQRCRWSWWEWLFRICWGSKWDEQNYNSMENPMLKPQNWQDYCCLFSLEQLGNQSLYMFYVLTLQTKALSHKEIIQDQSVFSHCLLFPIGQYSLLTRTFIMLGIIQKANNRYLFIRSKCKQSEM